MKIIKWTKEKAPNILKETLENCKQFRSKYEPAWKRNEATIYNTSGIIDTSDLLDGALDAEDITNWFNTSDEGELGINYTFKNFRFLHAQASANPPSVVARPTSTDPEDRRSADVADSLIRHALRAYKMQDKFDKVVEQCMLYGTSWIKTWWNPNAGEIKEATDTEITMTGAIQIDTPSTWDIWFDPHALQWSDGVRYVIERRWFTKDEVYSLYGSQEAKLICAQSAAAQDMSSTRYSFKYKTRAITQKMFPVYCYYEIGMPTNGMAGRYCEFVESGKLVSDISHNPFKFQQTNEAGADYEVAYLPYHILTDIDVADQVYGKSFIEYEALAQDLLNKLDSLQLENVQAHGVVRMVVPESCNIPDDAISDSAYDILKISGVTSPYFANPPSTMPATDMLRERIRQGIDDLAGVNESMFGQQSREQSGFSMQYATNQGNMIRRRFFNKYVQCVEQCYKGYLALIRKHWDVEHTIRVVGKEKSFETLAISGADIQGGFDLVVEFGANLSLDPQARREEIMQLMPVFEKYGVDGSVILGMLRLNEVEGLYDMVKMGERRQSEIFQEMLLENVYIAPNEWEEHTSYLKYCYYFTQTREFRDLPTNSQQLIITHMKEREQLAAAGAQGGAAPVDGGQPPGPDPQGIGPVPTQPMASQPQPATTTI